MIPRPLAAAALALAASQAFAQFAGAAPDPLAAAVLSRVDQSETPACIVVGLVDKQRSQVAAGCAPNAGPTPPDRDSLFEIGSIAKGLTAILLADMVVRGEVSLDDPASKYARPGARLPSRNGRDITLRDLATQTSGLPRLPPQFRPADPRNPYADFTADRLYEALAATQLMRDPGERYEYSNFGYMWLSDLLSRRAGKPFDALLKERVLDPLGMKDTALVSAPAPEGRVVMGHALPYEPAPAWISQAATSGSGGWRSSMNDMLKLAEALAGVSDTTLKQAIALAIDPQRAAFGRNSIGLAWNVHEGTAARIVWHNGGTGGFTSMIAANRGAKKAAVVLSDASAPFEDLALHLVDPDAPLRSTRVTAPVEPAERGQYAGNYTVSEQFMIRVFVEGERLMGQATAQPPFELGRESGDTFLVRGMPDAQVIFHRGANGAIDGLTLRQAGRDAFGARTP